MRFFLLAPVVALVALVACSSSDDTNTGTTQQTYTYEKDIFPIFQQQCALSACHGATESPQGVHFSQTDKEETYKALQKESVRFKGTKLIDPGNPDNSLVMRKMDGTQDQLESCPGDCGKAMPPPEDDSKPNGEILTEKTRNKVRKWIADGAKND